MFGVNSVEQVKQIAEGWTKDIVKAEQELHDKRMAICNECPLMTKDKFFGPRCDVGKCYNVKTGSIEHSRSKYSICGCNCWLDKATRVKSKKCVLGKW